MKRSIAALLIVCILTALLPMAAMADWYCTNCGAVWQDHNKFCGDCGTPRQTAQPANSGDPTQPPAAMTPVATPVATPVHVTLAPDAELTSPPLVTLVLPPSPLVTLAPATPTPEPTPIPTPTPTPVPTPGTTATPVPTFTPEPTRFPLSPDRKCRVTPTIYGRTRFSNRSTGQAVDTQEEFFRANDILNTRGKRDYGMYIKFTPSRTDEGYIITRFDVVVTDPEGNVAFSEGFNHFVDCTYGYFWYWEFFSFQSMFDAQIAANGEVTRGGYQVDIYFNEEWAGKTRFTVK